MPVNVQVIFHSTYGHVWRMAEAIAEGARQVQGAQVSISQVPETLSDEILAKMGATEARKAFAHIPIAKVEDLPNADVLFFGTPTRFGNMSGQMRAFFDATGKLWTKGSLIGKVASVFASTGTQHGGQETTITSFHTTLLHHGCIIVGVPYSCQELVNMNEITGGSPYGAGTLAGSDGSRKVSENELAIARFQGRHATGIAAKLAMK
jgi:NAD(P)H dehydrogenase (quinone)